MTQRPTQISEEYKASLAAMTDKEFQEWFCRYIDFLAYHIDPSASTVSARIVETMKACDGFSFNTASRYHLTSKLHQTSAYRRLFAETKGDAA